jgi:ankyrin repeat protein
MRLGLPIDVNDASLLTTAASSHCLPAVEHMLVRGTFTAEDIATAVEYSLDDNEEITFNTDVVRSLMRYAARFDTYPQLVEDALGFALRNRHEDAALYLLKMGAEKSLNKHGSCAAAHDCPRVVALLLAEDTECVGEQRKKVLTRIVRAGCDIGVMRMVLDGGADVSAASVVHASCRELRLDALKMLLDAGAKIDPRDSMSLHLLMWKAHTHPERHDDLVPMVQLLLDLGAPTRCPEGCWSALNRHARTEAWQLQLQPPVRAAFQSIIDRDPGLLGWRDKHGQTALHYAISKGDLEMAVFLAEAGADLNTRDGKDRPVPILLARSLRDIRRTDDTLRYVRSRVRTLLEAGMDPMQCDGEGRSVFQAVWEVECVRGAGSRRESVEDPAVAVLIDVFAQGILVRGAGKRHSRDRAAESVGERPGKKQRV